MRRRSLKRVFRRLPAFSGRPESPPFYQKKKRGSTDEKENHFSALSGRLSPTLESTALKLMEETGELAQVIGKYRGMSGEPSRMEQQKVVELIVEELVM